MSTVKQPQMTMTDHNAHELEWNFERPLALPGPSRYDLAIRGLTRPELNKVKELLTMLDDARHHSWKRQN